MTQKERVLQYINDFGSITALDGFRDLGVQRLAARIKDLTNDGVKISRKMETSKNRYGEPTSYMRYFLEES